MPRDLAAIPLDDRLHELIDIRVSGWRCECANHIGVERLGRSDLMETEALDQFL
jgi:hypothetical protein